MTNGEPEIDPHGSDIARFYDHQRTATHIARPHGRGLQQDLRHRPPDGAVGVQPRRAALADERAASGSWAPCSSRPPAGSGRTGTSQRAAPGRVRRPRDAARRPSGNRAGGRRSSTPSTSRCASGWAWSTCPRSPSSTSPGRARWPRSSSSCVQPVRRGRRPGRSTRRCSTTAGGILADLTIMRLGERPLPRRHRRRPGHARQEVVHRPPAGRRLGPAVRRDQRRWTTIGRVGAAGARPPAGGDGGRRVARRPSRSLHLPDGRHRRRARRWPRGSRYVGELGWEIYAPMEQGRARLGRALGGRPAARPRRRWASASYATTARLEKGYRAHGNELELDFNLVEAGMARPTVKDADFVGKEAYLEQRADPPAAVLCTLTVDDPTSSSGVKRYMLGREPILTPRRQAARRRPGPPLVRHQRRLRAVGRQAPPDVVPAAGAGGRRHRARSSSTSASSYPVTVAVAGARRCSTRTTRGSGLTCTGMHVLVCVKRVPRRAAASC